MEPNGEFSEMYVVDGYYKGKALLDKIDNVVRQAYYDRKNVEVNKKHRDLIWYLWAGRLSPLFGKDVMKTFERYFIDDKSTHKEVKNPYHKLVNEEKICDKIFVRIWFKSKNFSYYKWTYSC